MRETWYVLEDGSVADPNECACDEAGVLRHQSGAAVAMNGHVPKSRGVDDADAERAKAKEPAPKLEPKVETKEAPKPGNRELKAGKAKKYQIR